jgi:hypothetical protein
MKQILLALTVLAASAVGVFIAPQPASSAPYKWCARYNNMSGDCGFRTLEQCREAASGNGGGCALNAGWINKHPDWPLELDYQARFR